MRAKFTLWIWIFPLPLSRLFRRKRKSLHENLVHFSGNSYPLNENSLKITGKYFECLEREWNAPWFRTETADSWKLIRGRLYLHCTLSRLIRTAPVEERFNADKKLFSKQRKTKFSSVQFHFKIQQTYNLLISSFQFLKQELFNCLFWKQFCHKNLTSFQFPAF